ncbi:hypothetical protein Tco_0288885, partial [Tanacetum coccineum]
TDYNADFVKGTHGSLNKLISLISGLKSQSLILKLLENEMVQVGLCLGRETNVLLHQHECLAPYHLQQQIPPLHHSPKLVHPQRVNKLGYLQEWLVVGF